MASYPVYSKSASLPQFMYYNNTYTSDISAVGQLFPNSFYRPAPTTTPAGTARVNWVRAEINTVARARFATNYTPGKSELLPIPNPARTANPSLTQNPGY